MTTVDRRKWLAQRISFLESLLADGAKGEQRAAIESELAKLKDEAGFGSGRLRRWLLGIPWRPGDR